MQNMPMREFLQLFPRPVLVVDGALQVVAYSRRVLPVFGLRTRGMSASPEEVLTQVLVENEELSDQLALATTQLFKPGDEERFSWKHRDRTYAVTACPMGEEGNAFLVVFEDTTHRAMSEEILINARSYLEQILDDIPLGIVALNPEMRFTSINRRQLRFLERMRIELSLVEAIGATPEEALPEELGREWQRLCRAVLDSGERIEEGKKGYPVEEGELVLATMATPLRDQQGEIAGVILVADDVSEQTRLERELVKVEKLATVGQMVITINHEINNPLSIISTNAQTLRLLNRDLSEKNVAKLEKIEEQVRRIAEVTERLRQMDEVATSEYIDSGPDMIDVWGKEEGGQL